MTIHTPIHPDAVLLRGREAAVMVGVTERTIERWAQLGVLERVRIGGTTRYRRTDVEALAEARPPKNESPA